MFRTLISTDELAGHTEDAGWAVVDCRFALDDPEKGRRGYLEAHVPGAVYAHLNDDLSGPIVAGGTGRHPLPDAVSFGDKLSNWGIDRGVQVVGYDDVGGAMAARLWWMLRWMGHDAAAVLDGGLPKWVREGRPTRGGPERRGRRTFEPAVREEFVVHVEEVAKHAGDPAWRIVDSRTGDRYRGEFEPIDPVAGHIPGAINAPHPAIADGDGVFLSPEAIRAYFGSLLGGVPPERTVFYCGSGVTAARNLLAFAHAGLGDARLYAGSWSEWITDPSRPIATA